MTIQRNKFKGNPFLSAAQCHFWEWLTKTDNHQMIRVQIPTMGKLSENCFHTLKLRETKVNSFSTFYFDALPWIIAWENPSPKLCVGFLCFRSFELFHHSTFPSYLFLEGSNKFLGCHSFLIEKNGSNYQFFPYKKGANKQLLLCFLCEKFAFNIKKGR